MIIPIRCFTCGNLIAHLWNDYLAALQEEYNKLLNTYQDTITDEKKSTIENEILNKINVKRYCCRRMLLSHKDLCEKI